MTNRTTRLAPSPTGALHLGNARTFLINWAAARKAGWTVLLRIEDLDGPRVKALAAEQAIGTLKWLGIDYDGCVSYQSHDLQPYRDAMRTLAAAGRVFPCALTRREIEAAATAPHQGDHELRFPPELRPAGSVSAAFGDERMNYRLLVENEVIRIDDAVLGPSEHIPHEEIGDFVLWTKRGVPAYQLAVVVDDARQGVTDVIRGADLLASAARQVLLYRALGLTPPRWWHVPLVFGPDGRRLAKRHGDTRVSSYREQGVRPERIIGLLAFWSGLTERREELSADEFRAGFDWDTLPRSPITYTESDHQWLIAST